MKKLFFLFYIIIFLQLFLIVFLFISSNTKNEVKMSVYEGNAILYKEGYIYKIPFYNTEYPQKKN